MSMPICPSPLQLLLPLLMLTFAITASDALALEEVRDITNKKLISGLDYYILPVMRGRGGGLTLGPSMANQTCPLDVVQHPHEVSNGLPITFHPVNLKKGLVRVSTDLNIKFSGSTACAQTSTVWKLASFDEEVRRYFVTTGGREGSPGIGTLSNWFKIERDGNSKDYKLSFCPSVCKFCKVICKDIGIYVDSKGVGRLALSDETPFKIMFKKA